uniref:Chromatin assembly factor 1 subunit A n=1 Tax=Lygus hesperus TaxID=30085 RepID=A0A146LFT6_LYGHE
MGVGEVDGPPKKRLKQAQLPFCISSADKSGNKRKLDSVSPDSGLALKVSRKDSTPRALTYDKENFKVNNVDNDVEPVELLSDSDESNGIPKPANQTTVKESTTKRLDDRASEDDNAKEGVGNQVGSNLNREGEPEVDDDVITESKKTDDAGGNGGQVTDEGPGQNENAGKGESVVEKADGKINVDVPKQTEESAQEKVDNEKSAAVVESKVVCDDDKESKTASEAKETPDLDKTSDKTLESNQVETDLDRSIESEQGDPNSSLVVSSEDENNVSVSSTKKGSGATSVLRKADRAKRREEKMRLKKEKEELRRQKQEKKEKRERLKEEERKKKEDERKRKEEEKRKKEEVKEEEKRKKEEEKKKKEEVKEEEKRKKEEERKKKEEERKKKEESKEEDRKKKEEARLAEERKEQLAKKAFTKFFIQNKSKSNAPKKDEVDKPDESIETPKFMPFPVKSDMRLAVQVRHSISDEEKKVLSDAFEASCPPEKLYLDEIKSGARKPITGPATWPLFEEEHDVIIVESVVEEKSDHEDEAALCVKTKRQRAKLLQFHDNRRPPYWGTWRKKSSAVTPRKPFAQDKVFDYEVDSDSEWEDEEEGEDIDKEGESDKEQSDDENVGEDGYLLDNTFVPHGYLSDEEAAEEEENLNPEDQKLKLKVLKQEFEQELKAKTRLKPRLLGCVWISNETTEVSKGSLYETLMNLRCKWDESEGPIDPTGPAIVDCTPSPSLATTKFPSTLIGQLVRLVHGSRLSHISLITEFMSSLDKEKQLSTISKRAVSLKIKEIAVKTPSILGRAVWTVSPDLCAEYNLPSLEPPSIPSPAPILDTPPPKPKETALVNFLKKASTPQGARRRVTPTLVSPIVDLTKEVQTSEPGSSTALADSSKTEKPEALADSSSVTTSASSDTVKLGTAAAPPGVQKTETPPAAPPLRKRIQPITLSKTVSSSFKSPSTPKLAPIFNNFPDTPRPTPPPPPQSIDVVNLCSDSN